MRKHILGLDHVVIAVRDLERAREAYSRFGFMLTPRGHHSLGSQNHCIMFGRDYLELLAVPKAHPSLEYYSDFIARGEGVAALGLATDDAAAAHAELAAAGVSPDPPLALSRPVALADGIREASFGIVQLPVSRTPGCRVFLCQHFTRELVWRPQYQSHAVGATGIAALALVVEDPVGAAEAYRQILAGATERIEEGRLVATGGAPLAFASRWKLGHRLEGVGLPLRARPLVAALFIRVADRARALEVLRRGGAAPIALKDGSCAVSAEQAHGVALVFG